MKTCNRCGRQYSQPPPESQINEMGHWYTCPCKTTLFWPTQHPLLPQLREKRRELEDILERERRTREDGLGPVLPNHALENGTALLKQFQEMIELLEGGSK